MSTYICTKCGCIENTATAKGGYWRNYCDSKPVLCSECNTGKWHGIFNKDHWSKYGVEKILAANKASSGNFVNCKEYLRSIGKLENTNVEET